MQYSKYNQRRKLGKFHKCIQTENEHKVRKTKQNKTKNVGNFTYLFAPIFQIYN